MDGPVASFTADGAYDQDGVYRDVVARHPEAAVIVPPRSSAVPSDIAQTAPTTRDRHLQLISERGRMAWQRASGYHWRVLVEADISRFKRVIGDGLRFRTDRRRATQVAIAVDALNRMLELGRPGRAAAAWRPMQHSPMAPMPAYNEGEVLEADRAGSRLDEADPHLRSVAAVTDYHILATDGPIGHIQNFMLESDSWGVRYFIVDTRNWWPGQHVLLSPYAVKTID